MYALSKSLVGTVMVPKTATVLPRCMATTYIHIHIHAASNQVCKFSIKAPSWCLTGHNECLSSSWEWSDHCRFSRERVTNDPNDIPLDQCVYFMLGVGCLISWHNRLIITVLIIEKQAAPWFACLLPVIVQVSGHIYIACNAIASMCIYIL